MVMIPVCMYVCLSCWCVRTVIITALMLIVIIFFFNIIFQIIRGGAHLLHFQNVSH